MSGEFDFRALLLKIQDLLSDNDRHRFLFLLGEDVPRYLRDDPSLSGTLRVLESLLEKAIISDQDCDYLIKVFKKIHCNDAAKRLQEYQLALEHFSQRSCSLQDILLFDNDDEDKMFSPRIMRIPSDPNLTVDLYPLRGSSINIHPNARWQQNGLTVAGDNRQGNGINQLSNPFGLYVDDDQTIYVADRWNHRVVEWKRGATSGQVVAGGNGEGSGAHQLSEPLDVIVDKQTDSLIICDRSNTRVVRWSRRNRTSGETIISNIYCVGLAMDENGSLYVVDYRRAEVRLYRRGESQGIVVAGGNESGNRLDQLSIPQYVFVDRNHSVYVSDWRNHRVMKWMKGAKQGTVVAGGKEENGLIQLSDPQGVIVDQLGTIYVADDGNDRITRWPKGATKGSVIIGGNGRGGQSNQLNGPVGLSFDQHGNLYVVDSGNHRVQKFNIDSSQ
ncbi:unnamed protein product [Rotaria sordida]|uniref:DED domain-containing protein n=1 Tax=Rotaria sordida TaxID=392033 RepID=A0A814BW33_9BILA|nr:unnamed protein product [Rotaria sordida]